MGLRRHFKIFHNIYIKKKGLKLFKSGANTNGEMFMFRYLIRFTKIADFVTDFKVVKRTFKEY